MEIERPTSAFSEHFRLHHARRVERRLEAELRRCEWANADLKGDLAVAASVISRLAGENQALWSRADCLDVTIVKVSRDPVEIEPAPSPTVDMIRPRDHRPDAPSPIGRIAPADDRVPPPEDVPRVAGYFHVTNLGSLLDVLA